MTRERRLRWRLRVRDRIEDERGATLIWVASMMFVLLGMASFAVDLGWAYLNQTRLQRAADAAALAGVVYLPGFLPQATADAQAAAGANGFPVGGNTTMTVTQLADNKLEVTLTTKVPTFFLRVFGMSEFTLARKSTAEYVKPVPLGSDSNVFGNGNDPSQYFWAGIQAPYTQKHQGDPFATRCIQNSSPSTCTSTNPDYRPEGYYYAIEVASGVANVTVDIYDAGFYQRSSLDQETGDTRVDYNHTPDFTTNFALYGVDATPQDPTDNPPLGCQLSVGAEQNPSTYKNQWRTISCPALSGPVTPGIYVLRVWTTGSYAAASNHYAVRANAGSGPDPRVYGINDMSIFTNRISGTATLTLAEVAEVHAGKKLELSFFDPGDADGPTSFVVKMPDGTTATCSWYAEDENGVITASGSGACDIDTTGRIYNGQWIVATVDIPATYTCGANCWWTAQLNMNNAHDRTTWKARVIGNPVRLVPNGP